MIDVPTERDQDSSIRMGTTKARFMDTPNQLSLITVGCCNLASDDDGPAGNSQWRSTLLRTTGVVFLGSFANACHTGLTHDSDDACDGFPSET